MPLGFCKHLTALSACALFVGCASHRLPPDKFPFTTHITKDGLKLFQLAFPAPERQISFSQANPNARTRTTGYSERQLENMLAEAVERSKFCREGYLQLGRYAGETSERVRGECRERATAEDTQRYPNTLERW